MSITETRSRSNAPATPISSQVRIESGERERSPQKFNRRRRLQEQALAIAAPIVCLLLWQIASSTRIIDPMFFPPPSLVVSAGIDLVQDSAFWAAVLSTLRNLAIGYLAGVGLGLAVGVATGTSRWVRAMLEPILSALYSVPKLAILPLLLLIFGLGDVPRIVLVTISVYFYVWISTMTGLLAVPYGYREAAESLNANRFQMFRHVLLPGALPQIFVGLRLGAAAAILVLVAAEMVTGSEGIGYIIWLSWQTLATSKMYVGIVLIAVIGVIGMYLVKGLGALLTPWADSEPR
jgi:ABC-type nitrate/sulfonate/bicarbonate transport system permease component